MSDPDRLTSHDDTASVLDTRGLILRIIVVAFLAALFWHTVIAAGVLDADAQFDRRILDVPSTLPVRSMLQISISKATVRWPMVPPTPDHIRRNTTLRLFAGHFGDNRS